MKLEEDIIWLGEDKTCDRSIRDAVENICIDLDDGNQLGTVERVQAQVRETARLLAALIETLNASGKLADDEVLTLLNRFRPYGDPYRKAQFPRMAHAIPHKPTDRPMRVALLDDEHDDFWTGTFREWFRENRDWIGEISPAERREIWAGLRNGRAMPISGGSSPTIYIKKLR